MPRHRRGVLLVTFEVLYLRAYAKPIFIFITAFHSANRFFMQQIQENRKKPGLAG